jgi:magnesium-transporting ATPase (P-type)
MVFSDAGRCRATTEVKVDPAKGLSAAEAQQRLQQYGPNRLGAKKKESGWQTFLRQYRDLMQIILVTAAVIGLVFMGQGEHDRGAARPDRLQRYHHSKDITFP